MSQQILDKSEESWLEDLPIRSVSLVVFCHNFFDIFGDDWVKFVEIYKFYILWIIFAFRWLDNLTCQFLLLSFINQNVSTFAIFTWIFHQACSLGLCVVQIPAKGLLLYVLMEEKLHAFIIKFFPVFVKSDPFCGVLFRIWLIFTSLSMNERPVMARACSSSMDHNSDQSVNKLCIFVFRELIQLFLHFLIIVAQRFKLQVLFRWKFFQIQYVRKFKLRIDFLVLVCGEVKDKSLQVDNQNIGHFSKDISFVKLYFLLTIITIVLVNSLPVKSFLQTLLYTCSVLHRQR